MATLTFSERAAVNGPQLMSEIQTALSLSSLPLFAQVAKNFTVSHPDIAAGNQSAIQTVITNHVADPLFGVTVADLKPWIITMNGGAAITWTNMPLALTEAAGTRTKLQLQTASFGRLTCDVRAVGTAGALLIAQLSLDGTAWTSGPQVSLATTGLKVSTMVAIGNQFKTDCFFRLAGSGGDGVADPQLGLTTVQFA